MSYVRKGAKSNLTNLYIYTSIRKGRHQLVRACGLVVWFSLWATSCLNRKTKHARGPGFNSQLAPNNFFLPIYKIKVAVLQPLVLAIIKKWNSFSIFFLIEKFPFSIAYRIYVTCIYIYKVKTFGKFLIIPRSLKDIFVIINCRTNWLNQLLQRLDLQPLELEEHHLGNRLEHHLQRHLEHHQLGTT